MRRLLLPLLLLAALPASAAVTGTVVTGDGDPLAGARVRAFAREPFSAVAARLLSSTPEATPIATTETAADGRFSLDTKGNAAIDIVVDAAGREPYALYAAGGEDVGAIPLASAGKGRRIRVKGADGKPLANALVYLGHALLARTDADGKFARAFTGEAAFIIHPDYGVSTAAADRDEEMNMPRGAAVRGRVVGRDGTTPVAGAVISAAGWPLARSAEDGTFTIAHAPARFHALLATKGSEAGSATVDSAKNSTTIRLGNAASLSGTVAAKGDAPVAGATINLFGDGELYSAVSDAKGRFSIAALPPGSYSAQALHPSFVTARTGSIHAVAATTHAFTLQPRARVRGIVVGEDHKPVAGAFVGGGLTNGGLNALVMTTPAGEFNVAYAVSGPLFVEAWKSGYAVAISPMVTVQPGETKSGVTVTLQRGFPLQVKVVDRDKQPVPNAAVDIQIVGFADTMRTVPVPCSLIDRIACRLTAADGTMQTRLGEGKYNVYVTGTDFVPKTLPQQALNARVSPFVVTVERGAEVSGRVTFTDGTPVADARVTTSAPSGGMNALTDAGGAFTLKRLPRTALTLMATTTDEMPLRSAPVPVTPPARNVTITLATPARVEGRVIDRATSQPLTSFNIAVAGRGQGVMMRGVDVNSDDGTFVLKRVQPGSIELRVIAPGYVGGTVSDLFVEEGKALTGVEVKLDRGVKITGHVTAGGNAAAGVRVVPGARTHRVGYSAVTDDNGDYVLDGVASGEQTLDFSKEGFITKRKSVTVEAGKDARVDADLDRGREIRGRVVDRNGQPIRMANVSARQPSVMGYIPNVQTDDDGQFTVSGLEDGRYTVRANKNGWVGASIDDVDPAAARPLTLTLDRGATITGRVIGLPPEELPQVHVSASGNNAGSSQQTDASGNFALSGIPDGSVTITAYRQGMPQRQSAPKVIDVVNGSAPPVEIDFSAGITIRGRVTRNGTPVVAGNISFNARGRSMGRVAYATIGPDGSYEVDGVEPGDYDVRVFSMGLNDAVPYTVVSNATFDIDLKGATIRGVALDADSGAPLPDVRVYASSSSPDSRSGRNAATDSNGVFSLDALPDGTYTVRGEREHYAAAVQKLTVSGGSSAPIELRLSRGQEAVVRVVDAESGATIDGSVGLIDKQTKKFAGSSGYGRGDDGAIHVWAVPGSYTARVSAMNYMPESVDVVVPGPEVRVALHRGGTITVTSRSGGRFNIVPPSAPGGVVGGVITIGSGQGRGVSIPPGGRMSFSSLSAGVYEIDKYADDGKTVARRYTVTLPAGQTVTLDAD